MGAKGKEVQGYKELGFAIVEQAVHDYKNLDKQKKQYLRKSYCMQLKKFFRSDWCYQLCGIDKQVWEKFIDEYDTFKEQ